MKFLDFEDITDFNNAPEGAFEEFLPTELSDVSDSILPGQIEIEMTMKNGIHIHQKLEDAPENPD